jgi:hypothetical protein
MKTMTTLRSVALVALAISALACEDGAGPETGSSSDTAGLEDYTDTAEGGQVDGAGDDGGGGATDPLDAVGSKDAGEGGEGGDGTEPPPEDTVTPHEDTVTPPEDTVTPPEDTVTPPEDTVAPPEDTVTPPEDTTTEPDIQGEAPVVGNYAITFDSWMMQPGEEDTRCVVKRLSNEDEIWVRTIETQLAKGSHHLIVYKSEETEEQPMPFGCTPFTETLSGESVPLLISQIGEEKLVFPPKTALKLAPKQMIRIEAHYINLYGEEIEAEADVTFEAIDPAWVEDEVGFLFYGNPDFSLPAFQETQTPWKFLSAWPGTKVFALTGHTHQYGTNVEIQHATSVDDVIEDIYPLDEPYIWDEPPVIQYDPPVEIGEGEGFRYRCSWSNTTAKKIGFGESANQEMCFFWAYYYPSKGYRLCINTGQYKDYAPGLINEEECCPDSPICELIKGYLAGGF